ncbi:MAG: hypothetical protein M1819_007488 [Sarea resinae]|nr:MAG: hypothetical protein M1819_007488 [Sarea resinae]
MSASNPHGESEGAGNNPRHPVIIYDPEGEWMDGDDDMDYEPTTEGDEAEEYYEMDEDEQGELEDLVEDVEDFQVDAEQSLGDVEIEFAHALGDDLSESADDEGEETQTGEPRERQAATADTFRITQGQIMRLLGGHSGFARILAQHLPGGRAMLDEENDDLEGGYGGLPGRRRRRPKAELPKVPSDTGRELMESGTFGSNEPFEGSFKKKRKLSSRILNRELGLLDNVSRQRTANKLISQGLIPSSNADMIIHYDARCYSGQFSDDGNFFFSCAQDFRVRMYDTSNPYRWKYYKTVDYPVGQWTITDASLSPDNKLIAYSSIRSIVCLAPTDPGETGDPWMLDFSDLGTGARRRGHGYSHFGIWSIRFSGDGREIVAGTSDRSVYVHDIETRQSILKISGHQDDVNAVCFGDTSSPHILYSGSDDTTIKVWDRRSMGDSREAGVFLGHTEGVTYVDSKGDGRYVLSNGKDQTMKLWDLRKMISTDRFDKIDVNEYTSGFDYRFEPFDADYSPHPHDCSLVTFRGHKVLKTLIRCHFSPPGSTDSRYVYTGSEDGSVYIYNLDATLAGKVDVNDATHAPGHVEQYGSYRSSGGWKTCVRDASWHPTAPAIAATSWNGWGMSSGTCTLHTWNDGLDEDEAEPEMGVRVDQKLEHDQNIYENIRMGERTRLRSRRARMDEDSDSDWF